MLRNIVGVLARRWYVVVLGVLLTAGLGYGAMQATPSEYKARALILLLPSEEWVGEGGNPFLNLSGLEQPASIVVAYFASTAAQEEVAQQSDTAEYLVALDAVVRGPVILVEVTDESAEETLSTLDYLTQRIPEELLRLQQDVSAPESSIIGSMPLTVDTVAEQDDGNAIRLTIAAVAVGLAATGLLAFAVDGPLLRRQERRRARSATAAVLASLHASPPDTEDDHVDTMDDNPHSDADAPHGRESAEPGRWAHEADERGERDRRLGGHPPVKAVKDSSEDPVAQGSQRNRRR